MKWFKSESKMKGHEMAWDYQFLRFVPHGRCRTYFDLYLKTVTAGDHSPRIEFMFMIFNFCIAEINYMNIYHEEDGDYDYDIVRTLRDK